MTYAPHPESIDSLIASRLPAWLTGASLDRLRALQAAMTRQAKANEALKPILDAIPSLDAFAEPLIDAALRRRAIARPDVRYSTVKIRQRIVTPSISAALPAPTFTHVSRQTLLAAALHNYHVTETKPAPGRTGQLIDATGKHLGMGFEAFAGLCRTLDLGKAYQAVLAQQLRPSDSPAKVHGLFEESLAAHLEVAVRVAVLKGELDEQSYLELLPLIAPRPIVPPVSSSVIPRQLYLLGKCIRGVVTLEVRASPDAAVRGVIAWLPGDARQPVARYPSWAALYQALAEKLTDKSYRTFFSRFVSERDRPRFFSRLLELNRALGTGETLALDGRHQAIDGKLFAYLRELHIAKLFDDARVLAVPTGDEDEEDRRERLDAYLGLGLDVLNLAGLFVPLLGQAMLVVGALQIADEVYEGYLDWSVGDRQGALDHLFGVAENIAVGVAVGIGASAAREALQRVAFVDALVPLRNEAGALRLHAWALVDEVEIRLFYRLKLAYALDLPIKPETMHYQSFANVNTSDLLRARREVLAAENTQSLADSLSQRPFWEAYARHHYNDRFGEVVERFHTRLADLEALGKGAIDEWTFDLRSRAKLLRELAEEAFARM